MDPDTFRGDGTDVYWRRRVSVLTGVLVVVAVVAWACSSASGNPEGAERPQQTGPSGADAMVVSLPSPLASMLASPGAGAASGAAGPGGSAGGGAGAAGVPAAPSPGGAAMSSPNAHASPSPAPGRIRRHPGDPCQARDVVLSLRGDHDVYEGGARPAFLLTVVSTSRMPCTIDVGPRALELRITSGPDRVWSTADCVSGDGKDVQRLDRGVPYVRAITWDRHRSGRICGGEQAAARPGTYVAAAHIAMASARADRTVFRLR
ncbi:hypothetical protein J5X84_43385 [Streptosporangiaceae bacterium NEAU-GS5]|nr:hypothetical protein [Streptosporangiaceae bacterium NEAU-GS5]